MNFDKNAGVCLGKFLHILKAETQSFNFMYDTLLPNDAGRRNEQKTAFFGGKFAISLT